MTMNKSFTILFGIIGIYWILSSVLQQGSFLLLIPGILSLALVILFLRLIKYTRPHLYSYHDLFELKFLYFFLI